MTKEETLSDKINQEMHEYAGNIHVKHVKEFINIHIEDLDWLWEIHPKIYNRIVAKFKERAGDKLTK